MKIAVIGTGMVGVALAQGWHAAGHDVVFAVRDPASDKVRAARAATKDAIPAKLVQAAVAPSQVVVVATQFKDAEAAVAGAGSLQGKIVLDATNPILPDLSGLAIQGSDSAAERIARCATGAYVAKAFNTVGYNIMANTQFPGGKPAMLICSDAAPAREAALKLAYARGLGRDFAFALLRR